MANQANGSIHQIPLTTSAGIRKGDMLYRTLGRTGEQVSAIGMGGYHLANHGLSGKQSIRLIRDAIDRGITFMDNSWDYNEGQKRNRDGQGVERRLSPKSFSDDEDRRPH
jgi:hypothetical protein